MSHWMKRFGPSDEETTGVNLDLWNWTLGVRFDGEDLYIHQGPICYLIEVRQPASTE